MIFVGSFFFSPLKHEAIKAIYINTGGFVIAGKLNKICARKTDKGLDFC